VLSSDRAELSLDKSRPLAIVSTTGYTPTNAHEAPTDSVHISNTVKRLKVTISSNSDPRDSLRPCALALRPATSNRERFTGRAGLHPH
jgi:hypothetical protein